MADSELRRTHPATVAAGTLKTMWQGFVAGIAFAVLGAVSGRALVSLGIFAFVMLAAVIGAATTWIKWRLFRYGIVGDELVITEGWLVRKRRGIPLSRVHGVDIRADLFMRVLGVADVIVQTAGGGDDAEARIGQITLEDAEQLRSQLLARRAHDAAEAGSDTSTQTGTPPKAELGTDVVGRMSDLRGVFGGRERERIAPAFEYHVAIGRLALAAVTSRAVFIVLAAVLAGSLELIDIVGTDILDAAEEAAARLGLLAAGVIGLAVLLVAAIISIAVAVVRDYGFVARRFAERVETEAGLFERRQIGLPIGRIQALTVDETPLRRLLGWVSVSVVSAGFSAQQEGATTSSTLVPMARRAELYGLLHELVPEMARFPKLGPLPRRALRFHLTIPTLVTVGAFSVAALAVSLVREGIAPWVVLVGAVTLFVVAGLRTLEWRHARCGANAAALGIAHGMLGRRRTRIPRSRIQSLTVRQNPFQRRAGLATLVVAGVSGSSGTNYIVRHLGVDDAEQLMRWFQRATDSAAEPSATPSLGE